MLTDAELLLGSWRHLSAYAVNSATAQLEGIAFAGKIYDLGWRLRGSGVNSLVRVNAIAIEAGIGRAEVSALILPSMEQLGWVSLGRDAQGTVELVSETVPASAELLREASRVLDVVVSSAIDVAALEVLRSTTLQPLERGTVLERASRAAHGNEAAAQDAVDALERVNLVRCIVADDGRTAVFNPNIWLDDASVTLAALRTEDARVSSEIGALLEEVSSSQGMPEESVTSTDQRWIDFAVTNGLVLRNVVQTIDGSEKRFLFTPHLRDPFGTSQLDPSGHVRQLVGSMVYASTFAAHRLWSPYLFVRKLVQEGEAGNASDIATDYPMLETAGIVRVVPGAGTGRYRLQLLQTDVAEAALGILQTRERESGSQATVGGDLLGQRGYVHSEKERARIAETSTVGQVHQQRLIAALRETTARRSFNG